MRLGGCQDEDGMWRRLFQRFEEGIGSLLGDHVDFIDDVDLVARLVGSEVNFFPQLADFIDTAVAGGIHLDDIQGAALIDGTAHLAFIAGLALYRLQAVDRLGQDAPGAGLAGASGTAEEIGMGDVPAVDGIAQCLGNMLLTDYFRKGLGTPFAIKNLGGHDALIIL